MSRASRRKGARGECELAEALSAALGIEVRRRLGQARDGGDDIGIGALHFEAKRCERLLLMQWVRQVEMAVAESGRECGERRVPIVAFRQNRERWRVVLSLDDFLYLMDRKKARIEE